jgi:hypothetical protein
MDRGSKTGADTIAFRNEVNSAEHRYIVSARARWERRLLTQSGVTSGICNSVGQRTSGAESIDCMSLKRKLHSHPDRQCRHSIMTRAWSQLNFVGVERERKLYPVGELRPGIRDAMFRALEPL